MNTIKISARLGSALVVAILLMGQLGCHAKRHQIRAPERSVESVKGYSPNYEELQLAELIDYLGYLEQLPPLQRQAECRWLKQYNDIDSNLGVRIHLAFSLLVTPDCGETQMAVQLLELAGQSVDDDKLKHFLSYQSELAQRLFTESNHGGELVNKLDRWKDRNQLLVEQLQSCNAELKDVKTKLEALKAIEESLNHSGIH